jgi:hypothetical protein
MVGRLQKDLGLPFSQVPPEISALPSYIPGGHANNEPELSDAATVNFESGEAHSWWSALWDSHKRASNRRIRQQDRAVMRWAKTLADRYAKRQLDDVAFQTERIFTGIDRYLIGVGLNVKHGWGAQRAL